MAKINPIKVKVKFDMNFMQKEIIARHWTRLHFLATGISANDAVPALGYLAKAVEDGFNMPLNNSMQSDVVGKHGHMIIYDNLLEEISKLKSKAIRRLWW